MNEEVKTLKPAKVFENFAKILAIPRPSKKEEKMSKWLYEWGQSHGLETLRDEAGNIIMRKKATKGREDRPMVCLQGHMDMVCEKNADKVFDFEKDAIESYVEDGWLKAKGTTLGADDGIGVATILAIMESDDIEHGPLEALITVDEETGLTGASALKAGVLKSCMLLNFDNEDEGQMCIGCAGGEDTVGVLDFKREKTPCTNGEKAYRITVSGARGGHSGDDINRGRANANKLLNRILWTLDHKCGVALAEFDGGNLRNAIAREAHAVVVTTCGKIKDTVQSMGKDICFEFRSTESGLTVSIEEVPMPQSVVDAKSKETLFNLIYALPHGVLAMSREIENFVETSTNLASIKMEGDTFVICTSQRSSVASALTAATIKNEACFTMAGAKATHSNAYPGWTPNPDSKVVKIVVASYEKLFNKKPMVLAIHAGLECGLIGEKYPQMDMVSYGPTLKGVHSPDEKLEIATVELFWRHTLEILKNI
jgi:aminoacyl-histidine dipeptidase